MRKGLKNRSREKARKPGKAHLSAETITSVVGLTLADPPRVGAPHTKPPAPLMRPRRDQPLGPSL